MINLILPTTFQNLKTQYVIYTVFNPETVKFMYVGCCMLHQLLSLPDMRRVNGGYFHETSPFVITGHSVHDKKGDALICQRKVIREYGIPEMNKYGHYKTTKRGVECIETGVIYATILECARVQGIDPAALSRHLRGEKGHVTIKGMTYRRPI